MVNCSASINCLMQQVLQCSENHCKCYSKRCGWWLGKGEDLAAVVHTRCCPLSFIHLHPFLLVGLVLAKELMWFRETDCGAEVIWRSKEKQIPFLKNHSITIFIYHYLYSIPTIFIYHFFVTGFLLWLQSKVIYIGMLSKSLCRHV